MGKTPCCEKVVGLRKGRWSREEDEVLIRYIQAYGHGSWMSLPYKAGLLRCGKSCRLRWINYLRGGLKRGNFTKEEEEVIVKLHRSLGNRWSTIARHLPGRTDNEIKNYWNCHLSHKCNTFSRTKNDTIQPLVNTYNIVNQTKRKHDSMRKGKSNDQPLGHNSTFADIIIKESQICSNEIKMTKIDELEFKLNEQRDMSFVLGGAAMDSSGIKGQTNYSFTKVDYKENETLSSNSSQLMGFCFDENLENDWNMGFGFEGFTMCDNDNYNDSMFLWSWN